MTQPQSISRRHWFLLAVIAVVYGWSMIRPFDWATWFLEMLPVAMGCTKINRVGKDRVHGLFETISFCS